MVTLNREEQKEAHKILHKRIYDCDCKPLWDGYCQECQRAVIDFMNSYGAGVLTRDEDLEDLRNISNKLDKDISSLRKKLENKTKRLEELKMELDSHKN